jgi:hypothetical protein
MSEREALLVVLGGLAAMIVIGAVLPMLLPGLVRFVNRAILKEGETGDQHH